jgi:ribosomal protein L40E
VKNEGFLTINFSRLTKTMFCPKCGTENPETGMFCRTCGVGLGTVKEALSGGLIVSQAEEITDENGKKRRITNPDDLWSLSIREFLGGLGFFAISMVLYFTGVAGGRTWWWALLFPAFMMMSKGVSHFAKSKRLEKRQNTFVSQNAQLPLKQEVNTLPPTSTNYVNPNSIYETGELLERPPSVIEGTTRHLEINKEGETMTLPKR